MAVSIVRVEHTELFVGPPAAPEQLVRITIAGDQGPLASASRPAPSWPRSCRDTS